MNANAREFKKHEEEKAVKICAGKYDFESLRKVGDGWPSLRRET